VRSHERGLSLLHCIMTPLPRSASLLLVAMLVVGSASAAPGAADMDPDNDAVVAPPEAVPDCAVRLEAAGVTFTPATIPVKTSRSGLTCGAPDVVVYRGSPAKIRWAPAPVVTCSMALSLAQFDAVIQEEAQRLLGKRVVRIEQGGTYSCRKMARFKMVSEHSYANAIDLYSFRLEDGRSVRVVKDFGALEAEATLPGPIFLRTVTRRAYDEGLFSVVLTRFFDELHRDHFHLDQERYRIDGTREEPGGTR